MADAVECLFKVYKTKKESKVILKDFIIVFNKCIELNNDVNYAFNWIFSTSEGLHNKSPFDLILEGKAHSLIKKLDNLILLGA